MKISVGIDLSDGKIPLLSESFMLLWWIHMQISSREIISHLQKLFRKLWFFWAQYLNPIQKFKLDEKSKGKNNKQLKLFYGEIRFTPRMPQYIFMFLKKMATVA